MWSCSMIGIRLGWLREGKCLPSHGDEKYFSHNAHTSMEWVIAIRTPTWKTNRFENSRLLQVQIPELIITQRRLFVVSPQTVCGYQFNKPNFVVVVARIDASRTFMQAGKRTAPNANWPRTHFLELVHSFHYVSHIRWYLISWVELVTLLFTSFLFRCPSHHTAYKRTGLGK